VHGHCQISRSENQGLPGRTAGEIGGAGTPPEAITPRPPREGRQHGRTLITPDRRHLAVQKGLRSAGRKVARRELSSSSRPLPKRGQDLLVDALSGNIRGAGPAVAEIEFDRDPGDQDRPAELFLVFAGDNCRPGAYNYPLYAVFCDPMHIGGLLLSPKLHRGFTFTIIDMDHHGHDGDRVIRLDVPERIWDVACLLQNPDRFAVEAIHSRYVPG
jgi:hypothetical protein